jgi:hypothetical protein
MTSSTSANQTSEDLLESAVVADSVPQLKEALDHARSTSLSTYDDFTNSALKSAVQHGAVHTTAHFFEEENVWMANLNVLDIVANPSLALFEVLLEWGWDINEAGAKNSLFKGKRAIDWVCAQDELVKWLVEHDALLDGGEDEHTDTLEARPPMLLETCATQGSVETFKLLHSRGARLGRRTLHMTVSEAAQMGVNPAHPGSEQDLGETKREEAAQRSKWMNDRGEMLRYLVDELHLDVNAMDVDQEKTMHYGPPLNYAAREPNGAAVVKWLLEKGADPNVTSADGTTRAEDWARDMKADKVLEVLKAWKGDTGSTQKS